MNSGKQTNATTQPHNHHTTERTHVPRIHLIYGASDYDTDDDPGVDKDNKGK